MGASRVTQPGCRWMLLCKSAGYAWCKMYMISFRAQRTHSVIMMSLLRQNHLVTSFRRNNDAIITSYVSWGTSFLMNYRHFFPCMSPMKMCLTMSLFGVISCHCFHFIVKFCCINLLNICPYGCMQEIISMLLKCPKHNLCRILLFKTVMSIHAVSLQSSPTIAIWAPCKLSKWLD